MKIIAIEEHFRTEYYINYLQSRKECPRLESIEDENKQKIWREYSSAEEYVLWSPKEHNRICDIGEGRLREMDEAGIDMQVLSFMIGLDSFNAAEGMALSMQVNDDLSNVVKKHPKRFAGFAALAFKGLNGAADELERSVKQLGLK
jgi:hypothetical protein